MDRIVANNDAGSRGEPTYKQVDCAIIFMLAEERKLFLESNHKFINIQQGGDENFNEFYFIDKTGKLRLGVICSSEEDMGNHAAGKLFYRLSRRYRASLYINIGVAGRISQINVGDVIFVDRLSSAGENNANNSRYHLTPANVNHSAAIREVIGFFCSKKFEFSQYSKDLHKAFVRGVKAAAPRDGSGLAEAGKANVCRRGWCVTFPEVIKDREHPDFKNFMETGVRNKAHVADMEAYYLSEWHDLIEEEEGTSDGGSSDFIAIKSVSDCGDERKELYEKCGSRRLAMNNLAEITTCLCCERYDFPAIERDAGSLWSFFREHINERSVVSTVADMLSRRSCECEKLSLIEKAEKMFRYSIRTEGVAGDVGFREIRDILAEDNSLVTVYGRPGTGKSTYLSLLYTYLSIAGRNVVFWEIPFFSGSSKSPNRSSSRQIIYFLSRLLEEDDSLILIVDGINTLAADGAENDFIALLSKRPIKHLCVCCGEMTDSTEKILTQIHSKTKLSAKIEFSGVCAGSQHFDDLFRSATEFFEAASGTQLSVDAEIIKSFLKNSGGQPKIISVDYLFLYMIFEKSNLFREQNFKYLHMFLQAYLNDKYGANSIEKYYEEVQALLAGGDGRPSEGPGFNFSEKFRYNAYAQDFAYVTAFYNLFNTVDNSEEHEMELKNFCKKEMIFPSDITGILEDKVIAGRNANPKNNKALDNMVRVIAEDSEKSLEMETQLMYTACDLCGKNSSDHDKLRAVLKDMLQDIEKRHVSVKDSKGKMTALRYRSLCVIAAIFFDEDAYLSRYNNLILKNAEIARLNVSFHFHYYAREIFKFEDVISHDLLNSHNEMFYNTYYVLEQSLRGPVGEAEMTDQFLLHNLITYLHLFKKFILPSNRYPNLVPDVKRLLSGYRDAYGRIPSERIEFHSELMSQLNGALEN